MRFLIASVGTRGDVEPALALALEVRNLGHEARLCIPPNFTGWARELGFEAQPLGIEMRAPRPGETPAPMLDLITDQFETLLAAAEDCDLLLGGGVHQYAARSIAEVRKMPCVIGAYAPVSLPSTDLSPPGQPSAANDPAALAHLWAEARQAWNARSLERVNANRGRLQLSPIDDVLGHILGDRPWLAADATLAPAPTTPGMQIVQTGAWILTDARALPREIEAFLSDGEAPIYFGLGSMPAPSSAGRPLIEAARAAGRRIILSRGWANLEGAEEAPDCITIDEVSHQALFPRVAVVVHHGGAGTTTAAALAGTPQIATPMFADQFYFARRINELGLGASTPFAGMSIDTLKPALAKALAPAVAARAREVSCVIVANGAAIAARRLVRDYF